MGYYIGKIPCKNDLYHFGILGMKWGIRRYQNEDGTLTEAGKRRRQRILNNPRKLARHYDEFSQEEINAAMKKAQQKQQLRDLSNKSIRSGKEVADSVLSYGKLAGLAIGIIGAGVGTYKIATSSGIKSVADVVKTGETFAKKIVDVAMPFLGLKS